MRTRALGVTFVLLLAGEMFSSASNAPKSEAAAIRAFIAYLDSRSGYVGRAVHHPEHGFRVRQLDCRELKDDLNKITAGTPTEPGKDYFEADGTLDAVGKDGACWDIRFLSPTNKDAGAAMDASSGHVLFAWTRELRDARLLGKSDEEIAVIQAFTNRWNRSVSPKLSKDSDLNAWVNSPWSVSAAIRDCGTLYNEYETKKVDQLFGSTKSLSRSGACWLVMIDSGMGWLIRGAMDSHGKNLLLAWTQGDPKEG